MQSGGTFQGCLRDFVEVYSKVFVGAFTGMLKMCCNDEAEHLSLSSLNIVVDLHCIAYA